MSLLLLFRNNFEQTYPTRVSDQVVWVVVAYEPTTPVIQTMPMQSVSQYEPNNIIAEYVNTAIIVRTL